MFNLTECQASNNRLQRTVMHKVPRHIRQRAAAEPGRSAALGRERLTKRAASSSHDEATVRVGGKLGGIVEALEVEQRKKPFLVT